MSTIFKTHETEFNKTEYSICLNMLQYTVLAWATITWRYYIAYEWL